MMKKNSKYNHCCDIYRLIEILSQYINDSNVICGGRGLGQLHSVHNQYKAGCGRERCFNSFVLFLGNSELSENCYETHERHGIMYMHVSLFPHHDLIAC